MRRTLFWIPVGVAAAVLLAVWGIWTWRVTQNNAIMANELEAERQRSFSEMVGHVEQIQALLGKGLVAGTTQHNMRYMSDVHLHAQAAVRNFTALPLPAEISVATGKFLQQTGDFAVSVLRAESSGREMTPHGRAELARLRTEAQQLSASLQQIAERYNQGNFRWNPPTAFSWAALTGQTGGTVGKQHPSPQSPASMIEGGWDQVGASMGRLPVLLYDGPFSDHVGKRAPAMSGPTVTREDATQRMRGYVPNADRYTIAAVAEAAGNIPAYTFRLTPTGGTPEYTLMAEVARNGGFLLQFINSRAVGPPKLDLGRARTIASEYLTRVGYTGLSPTYGQAEDGSATIAFAHHQNGVVAYPDQIKVKVALDTGEILGVDARQYIMNHHTRTLGPAKLSPEEAQRALNDSLRVERVQLALIPDEAGTGEILTYEFLTSAGNDTFLIYINANTGNEEQILQKIETDGGTFTL